MSSKSCLILGILWIIMSPLCFFAENTLMGIVWLCAGSAELIIGLIKRDREKKNI